MHRRADAWRVWVIGAAVLTATVARAQGVSAPLVRLRGTDFSGGGARTYGSVQHGLTRVNYVYAAPTGDLSAMGADFSLDVVPKAKLFLHVRGMLDDGGTPCPIRITVNETVLFEGSHAFPNNEWAIRSYPIPPAALVAGKNHLEFRNLSAEGLPGMYPWFMLAVCAIGPKEAQVSLLPSLIDDFRVDLPAEVRPLPEPLSGGHTEPGFRWRGIKGWLWRPEQYLAEIPVLAQCRMNFLMNCYGSMFDIEHFGFGDPRANRWWEPLAPPKKAAYEQVVRSCQAHGIEFCFSLNPNLATSRLLDYDSAADREALWQHYEWMQSLGVNWFNLQFDDISAGIDAAGQARVTNLLLARLRRRNPQTQMVFCPTYYWGTGEGEAARAYLQTLARDLHPDVYVFWTGPQVVSKTISRAAAASYRKLVGHRLFIWDNYPVNDGAPTLHLGPLTGRDADLCEVADGFMSNPMHTENQINRIPLLTIADYAYNPWDYDPARSIGQAIVHLAPRQAQRETLRDLVELFPGMLLYGQGTGYNPLLTRFQETVETPHSRWLAQLEVSHVESVLARLESQFPGQYAAARETLGRSLRTMQLVLQAAYGGVRP